MRKIIYTSFLFIVFLLAFSNTSSAKSPIKIIVNNEELKLSTPPISENGTTLVPLRSIFEALGITPTWNSKDKTITAENDGTKIWLQLNNKVAKVGNKDVILNVSAKTINGNTLVPLRFITESFGIEPQWNGNTSTITINTNGQITNNARRVVIDENNINDYFSLNYGEVLKETNGHYETGYYNGGRYVIFIDKDVTFLFGDISENDFNAKVMGIGIRNESSLFGMQNEMTIAQVKEILGEPDSEGFGETDEGYVWIIYYRIGSYDLILHCDKPQEPVNLIKVLKK